MKGYTVHVGVYVRQRVVRMCDRVAKKKNRMKGGEFFVWVVGIKEKERFCYGCVRQGPAMEVTAWRQKNTKARGSHYSREITHGHPALGAPFTIHRAPFGPSLQAPLVA